MEEYNRLLQKLDPRGQSNSDVEVYLRLARLCAQARPADFVEKAALFYERVLDWSELLPLEDLG